MALCPWKEINTECHFSREVQTVADARRLVYEEVCMAKCYLSEKGYTPKEPKILVVKRYRAVVKD